MKFYLSLWFWLAISPIAASANEAICEKERDLATLKVAVAEMDLWKICQADKSTRECSQIKIKLGRLVIESVETKYRCGFKTYAEYKSDKLFNLLKLVELYEAGLAQQFFSESDLNRARIEALDFQWYAAQIPTLPYCSQKFKLLEAAWMAALKLDANQEDRHSEVLEVELAVQKLREFCRLEGQIELPALRLAPEIILN